MYELIVTVVLMEDIKAEQSLEGISKFINVTMLQDEELKSFHKQTGYKHYSFNSFYPLETDKLYKKGRIYVVRIRSARYAFLQKLQRLMPKTTNQSLKVLACQLKRLPQRHIESLYTVTPAIATVDGKPFLPDDDVEVLLKRLQGNLEKKYKDLYGDATFGNSFIKRIEIINKKPIGLVYKNMKLLGNKLKIEVNEDDMSQRLAQVALCSGLLEKNSIGGGFCFANYV